MASRQSSSRRCQGAFTIRSGERAGQELLARHRAALPDAVVCVNDQMAIGVLRALTAAGVRVPDEIAVTGFDDLYTARLADPPLTTVRQPMHLLGERACARLLDRIARPSLSPSVQLMILQLMAVTASRTTRQIELICVSQLPSTENSTGVQIGGSGAGSAWALVMHLSERSVTPCDWRISVPGAARTRSSSARCRWSRRAAARRRRWGSTRSLRSGSRS